MKIISIADEHTNLMFNLIGIETINIDAKDTDAYIDKFDELLEKEEIGMIIITEQDLLRHKDYFKQVKMRQSPVVIEVPKLIGPLKEDYFETFIEDFIGLTMQQ